MIPEERRKNILIKLRENGYAKPENLAEYLGVSKITILRDIQVLKNQGDIKKIRGGIKITEDLEKNLEPSFYIRMQKNFSKKMDIAKKSFTYLTDSKNIFLDSSSTVFVFAVEILKNFERDKNFITNSPAIIAEAIKYPQVNLISTGGELKQDFNIFGGHWVNEFLEKINIDCAFVSCAGVSSSGWVTTNNKDLSIILMHILKKAKKVNLLADSTKFFKEGMLNIAHLSNFSRLVTDNELSMNILKLIRKISDIEVIN